MEQIPAQRRPHCPPVERLAILELRAARAYSSCDSLSCCPLPHDIKSSELARLLGRR
jgi:hypothetical protein